MNKIERVNAVLNCEKPDFIPAGFWYHFDPTNNTYTIAQNHLRTFRETGVDLYKVMQDYIQPIEVSVQSPSDWDKVSYPGESSPVFHRLLDVIKMILDTTGHDALVFQTMFGPLKTIVQSYGYDMVMHYSKTSPQQLAAAVKRVAQAQTEWVAGFMEAGIDGLFYSGQFSEPGRFTDEEFNLLVKEGDLTVLNAAESCGARNILHICGEPDYDYVSMPRRYTDYPCAIVNWSVKDTGLSISEGRKLFGGKPVLGGVNNRGVILNGSDREIEAEVNGIIESIDNLNGYMLGADCTIQGHGISNEKIKVAVDTAHEYMSKNR